MLWVCAGLGDIAVPGLLACLALRFDASRSADIRARGEAAGLALQGSLDAQVCDIAMMVAMTIVTPPTVRVKQRRCCSGSQLLQAGHVGVQVFETCCASTVDGMMSCAMLDFL